MTNTNRHFAFGIALLLTTIGASASDRRVHYSVVDLNKVPTYTATVISDISQKAVIKEVLFEDAAGNRFVLTNRRDFEAQTDDYDFARVGSKAGLKASFKFPFKSRTLEETMQEAKTRGSDEVPITIHANGRHWETTESELKDKIKASKFRKELKSNASELLQALDAVRTAFTFPAFSDLCSGFIPFFEGEPCPKSRTIMIGQIPADCSFDAKFGRACSVDRAALVSNAWARHQPLRSY